MPKSSIPRFLSPLRYPGGKGSLGAFVGKLITQCNPRPRIYVEPFAGGAGIALRLLMEEHVDSIILNDLHRGVSTFWKAILYNTNEFIEIMEKTPVDIDTWHIQKAIFDDQESSELSLGFATFFLNRTNRSGILGARPIGGLDQASKWTIDARFNKPDLRTRIELVARYRDRISVKQQNALDLLRDMDSEWNQSFIYADPPYLQKSADLYLNNLSWPDHMDLACLLRSRGGCWMITYDADDRVIKNLYPDLRAARFGIAHTAGYQRLGDEIVVFSDDCVVERMVGVGSGTANWINSSLACT